MQKKKLFLTVVHEFSVCRMTSNAGQKGAMNGDKTAKDKGPAKTFTGVSLKSGAAPAEKSFSDGKYAGELRAGKRDGEGTHVYSWGGIYTGQWKNDKKHGRGKICDKWGGIRGRLGQRQEGGARREPVEQWAAL